MGRLLMHYCIIHLTLINEGRRSMGGRGNYRLAIVKVKEDYENIKASLEDISRERWF